MSGKTGNGNARHHALFAAIGFPVRGFCRPMVAAVLALVLALLNSAVFAVDSPSPLPPCNVNHCGLLADGAYPHLVIGRLAHVGTPADMDQVFHWAKAHGYWESLPASITPYLRDVQMVTIDVPKGKASQPVTLFMLHTEFTAAPYHVGDLVRYAPHDTEHDEAATGGADDLALFHKLTGCVAVLCRKGDGACLARYRQGVFRHADGRQISLATGQPATAGAHIDPVSLLPLH